MTTPTAPKRRRFPWRRVLTGLAILIALGAVIAAVVARQNIVRVPENPHHHSNWCTGIGTR